MSVLPTTVRLPRSQIEKRLTDREKEPFNLSHERFGCPAARHVRGSWIAMLGMSRQLVPLQTDDTKDTEVTERMSGPIFSILGHSVSEPIFSTLAHSSSEF